MPAFFLFLHRFQILTSVRFQIGFIKGVIIGEHEEEFPGIIDLDRCVPGDEIKDVTSPSGIGTEKMNVVSRHIYALYK